MGHKSCVERSCAFKICLCGGGLCLCQNVAIVDGARATAKVAQLLSVVDTSSRGVVQ
jgi:hypothetical protein